MAGTNTLLTDERIIEITIKVILGLGSVIVAMGGLGLLLMKYIFKKITDEIKEYRVESIQMRSDFNDTLTNKFKAINFYMRETDKLQVTHEKNFETLNDHAREIKLKINRHEDRLNTHGEKLAEHDVQLRNLKQG